MKTIVKSVKVGIYENCEYMARIYDDKVTVVSPYVKWVGNTGGYAEHKDTIRNQQKARKISEFVKNGREELAWGMIGDCLNDTYLQCANF